MPHVPIWVRVTVSTATIVIGVDTAGGHPCVGAV